MVVGEAVEVHISFQSVALIHAHEDAVCCGASNYLAGEELLELAVWRALDEGVLECRSWDRLVNAGSVVGQKLDERAPGQAERHAPDHVLERARAAREVGAGFGE